MSEVTERLWVEYEDFCKRDLAEHAVVYLFVTASPSGSVGPAARGGAGRLHGIGEDGRKVLLGLMAGSKEDVETVRAFFQDPQSRCVGRVN